MLNKTETKIKCDAKGCKKNAQYFFDVKGTGKCFLCGDCLALLFEDARKAKGKGGKQ